MSLTCLRLSQGAATRGARETSLTIVDLHKMTLGVPIRLDSTGIRTCLEPAAEGRVLIWKTVGCRPNQKPAWVVCGASGGRRKSNTRRHRMTLGIPIRSASTGRCTCPDLVEGDQGQWCWRRGMRRRRKSKVLVRQCLIRCLQGMLLLIRLVTIYYKRTPRALRVWTANFLKPCPRTSVKSSFPITSHGNTLETRRPHELEAVVRPAGFRARLSRCQRRHRSRRNAEGRKRNRRTRRTQLRWKTQKESRSQRLQPWQRRREAGQRKRSLLSLRHPLLKPTKWLPGRSPESLRPVLMKGQVQQGL